MLLARLFGNFGGYFGNIEELARKQQTKDKLEIKDGSEEKVWEEVERCTWGEWRKMDCCKDYFQ